MSNHTGISKKVYKFVCKHPGWIASDIAAYFKIPTKVISSSLNNLYNNQNVVREKNGDKKNTKYYIKPYPKEQATVSPTPMKNIVDTITVTKQKSENSELTEDYIISTLSGSERTLYFDFKEKGVIAGLIISARRERITRERVVLNA